MQQISAANNKAMDVYRTIAIKPEKIRELDNLHAQGFDSADEIVYKQGNDTFIAVGRGDLRGVKAGDKVTISSGAGPSEVDVLYVNNRANSFAEAGWRSLGFAAIPGTIVGGCVAAVAHLCFAGPVGVAIAGVVGVALGTAFIWAQMASGLSGKPDSFWFDVRG